MPFVQWVNNAKMYPEVYRLFISPWIDGKKAVMGTGKLQKKMLSLFRNMKGNGMKFSMAFMMWLTLVPSKMDILIMMNWMLFLL